MALTDVGIKKLKPQEKPKKYTDSNGLYLLVTPSGSKCWRLKYRHLDKEKVLAIGMYPEISLQEARNKAREAKELIREIKDPNTEKKEKVRLAKYQAGNTFSSVAEEWHELNKHNWTEKYAKKVLNRLKTHAFKKIGDRPISEISALEIVEDIIRPIEKKGHTETSHKLLQNCSAIFRLAVLTKRAPFNPLADLRGILKPHKVTSLPSISIKELPVFISEVDKLDVRPIEKLAVKLLLLTFVRQGELRKSKWEYIDFEKKLWTIPAELMKMREEHLVPLSHQSISTLVEIKKFSGDGEYIFPTYNKIKNPYMNENVINKIIKKTSFSEKMVGHGFRSLASTTLNELGYNSDVIERQLAHGERNAVRAAYNRAEYMPQRIQMMQEWADYVGKLTHEW